MTSPNPSPLDGSEFEIRQLGSIGDLGNSVCREVFTHWNTLNTAGKSGCFDLIEVPTAIPHLIMLDLSDRPRAYRCRMSGQAFVAMLGRDLTGKLVDEDPLVLKFCQAVIEMKSAVYSQDGFFAGLPGRERRFDETIALPLLDESCNTGSVLLVCGPKN